MKSQKVNLVESVVAAVDLTRRRFVGFDGNVCANGVRQAAHPAVHFT